MGTRLKLPSVGCHPWSVKNPATPTCRSAGTDSSTRNTTIRSTTHPATAATALSDQTRAASLRERDKELVLDDPVDLGRLRELEELLGEPLGRRLHDEIERPRERELPRAHVLDGRRDAIHGQELDRGSVPCVELRGADR